MWVYILAPVKISAVKGNYQRLGSGDVCGYRDIVKGTHSEQLLLALVMGSLGARIAEVDQKINLIVCYAKRDLLLAPLMTCQQTLNVKSCGVGNILCSNACGSKAVLAQYSAVSNTELCH